MKLLRIVLIVIAVGLFALVVQGFIVDAWTCARWQIKALAIYSIIGGQVEAWWTASPLRIAAGLLWNNSDALLQILGAVVGGIVQGWVKK